MCRRPIYQQYRRLVADGAMWPNLAIVSVPSLAFSHGVVEAHEPVLVQALRPELAVEQFDEHVVGRLARPAEVERHVARVAEIMRRGSYLCVALSGSGCGTSDRHAAAG